MTFEEMDELLLYWEQLDGGWASDGVTREECAALLASAEGTLAEWKERLIKLPSDLTVRYERVLEKLLEEDLIDEAALTYELKVMHQFSPAMLVRRGRHFADLIKRHRESPLYNPPKV
jgi:hypothetical protein